MRKNRALIRILLAYSVYALVLSLLQVTLPDAVSYGGQRPDLTLILAVLAGYMFGGADGYAVGLAAGLMRDLLAGRSLGLGMLILMTLGMLASVLFQQLFRRNILLGLVQIVIFTVVYEGLITLFSFLIPMLPGVTHPLASLLQSLLDRLPAQILVNVLAGIPLIFLLAFVGPYNRGSRSDDPDDAIVGDSVWRVS
jgi:rod shape-determining protein MreD